MRRIFGARAHPYASVTASTVPRGIVHLALFPAGAAAGASVAFQLPGVTWDRESIFLRFKRARRPGTQVAA
ncbi:hypothetical protein PUN4_330123 [Paraburkholderia unamae]|nr:hypothetical protein PUN4_330123 [Paraburkholderia unamae]